PRLTEVDLGGSWTANDRTVLDVALAGLAQTLPHSSLRSLCVGSLPVRQLLAALRSVPSWGGLEILDLSERGLSGDDLRAFLTCSQLAGLRRLGLANCDLGPDDARALAACPYLSGL